MRAFITDTTERIEWFDHARSGVDSVTCDYLYMVSPTPVGCVYFSLGGKSDPNPAGYTIEYATGVDEWQEVSRIIDQTKAFKTSGYLEFSADGDKEPVTLDEAPTGLPAYRDHYWYRIAFTASTKIKVKWAGAFLADNNMLNAEFPLLKPDAMKKAFDPDISSWSRQLNLATQLFLQDVEKSTTTKDIGYTLVRRDRCSPAVNAKAASIIYSGLRNYTERAEAAEALYKERLQALLEADTDGEPSDDVTASGPKVYRMSY